MDRREETRRAICTYYGVEYSPEIVENPTESQKARVDALTDKMLQMQKEIRERQQAENSTPSDPEEKA